MSRYTGPVCRLCRRETAASKTGEKIKLFLKGDRCLSKKCAVERRGTAPGQKTHRQIADESLRVRPSAAREAEDAPLLRRARDAVRELLPRSRARPGANRTHVPAAARTPSRQRRVSHESGRQPRAGASARHAPPLPRERPDRQHSVVHREAGRRDLDRRAQPEVAGLRSRTSKSPAAAGPPSGWTGTIRTRREKSCSSRRASKSTRRSTSS